jgi:hypothetical protein
LSEQVVAHDAIHHTSDSPDAIDLFKAIPSPDCFHQVRYRYHPIGILGNRAKPIDVCDREERFIFGSSPTLATLATSQTE